ncbi:hypothetical protein Gogos_003528 [Gossypium gossypioides]|uniref:Uncharacterized protein n=1 Tax=Gossypium gossypioides TaxID=34282 RepID=A0A7J9CN58_GOSGO|nr:hypothetical protein [Gossypium gossypioides]
MLSVFVLVVLESIFKLLIL